jgi:hypothetical protein
MAILVLSPACTIPALVVILVKASGCVERISILLSNSVTTIFVPDTKFLNFNMLPVFSLKTLAPTS